MFAGKARAYPSETTFHMKRLGRDKNSSLSGTFVINGHKFSITLTPVANVLKLFIVVSYDFS
jgi:hypothetical protein